MVMRSPISQYKKTPVDLKKGTWMPEEDQKLLAYIARYGIWNWNEMPKYAGLLRSGKSCRLRWMNYLRPGIKHGNFSREEEQAIIELHKVHGNRWAAIAAKLPQRTDNQIKNLWNTRLRKQVGTTTTTTKSSVASKPNPNSISTSVESNGPKSFEILQSPSISVQMLQGDDILSSSNPYELNFDQFLRSSESPLDASWEIVDYSQLSEASWLWLHESSLENDLFYYQVDNLW